MHSLPLRPLSIITLVFFLFTTLVAPVSAAAVTYIYDANGNMTSDGAKCYEYNEANQLKKVRKCSNNQTIAEYIYDYQGDRIVKKEYENGFLKNTIYSPSDEYETKKIASNGTFQNTTYYKANDEVYAKKNSDGTKTYYQNDHLGSNGVLTDQSGGVVEKTKYDPFGEVKSGGTKSKFQYTGQEKDNETGLNYYGARYYDPHIQRFTQPDPVVDNVYDPQNLNRYSYVKNNPLTYTDPSGNIAIIPFLLIAGGIIGATAGIADVAFNNPNPTPQDYGNAAIKGAGGGVVTTGVAIFAAAPVAEAAISIGVAAGPAALIGDAIGGGVAGVVQNGYNNYTHKQDVLNNAPQALAAGIVTAGTGGKIANKIMPETVGRPATKVTLFFSGKKSVEHTTRGAISQFIESVTIPVAAKAIQNVKNQISQANTKSKHKK